jgi:hypothetical protein
MKKIFVFLMLLFALSQASPCFGQSYGKELDKTWRSVFGIDEKKDGKFRWFGYPVDNFGLLTSYDPPAGKDWKVSDRICATWRCIEIPGATVLQMNDKDRREINDSQGGTYADVGGGGAITLTQDQQKKLGLNLILPNLLQVLNITGGLDWSKGVQINLTMQTGYLRSIDRDKYQKFLEQKSTNQTLKTAFANGRLAYIANDIVAENVDVTVTVDKKKNIGVDAALTKAVGTVLSPESALKFQWGSNGNGTYHLVIKNPVVIAVQTRHQPGAGVLTADAKMDLKNVIDVVLPRPAGADFQ